MSNGQLKKESSVLLREALEPQYSSKMVHWIMTGLIIIEGKGIDCYDRRLNMRCLFQPIHHFCFRTN